MRKGVKNMKRPIAAVVLVVAVGFAGGCAEKTGVTAAGAEGDRAPVLHGPSPVPAPDESYAPHTIPDMSKVSNESGPMVFDWAPPPNFSKLVSWSDAAVTGRVTAISEPRWNVPAGGQPDQLAIRFRDASFAVDEVIYDSQKVRVAPGTVLTVRLKGDGSEGGPDLHGAEPVKKLNQLAGPVSVGDRMLWVLATDDFPFRDGTSEPVVKLSADYFSSWKIGADLLALNPHPQRTVPLTPLVAKLKAERLTPTDIKNNSQRGIINPLE